MIIYPINTNAGLNKVSSLGDGTTINVKWYNCYSNIDGYKVAQNIYYSENRDSIFTEGVKYVSVDGYDNVNIIDLTPGQLYYFCVRPVEYDPNFININQIPDAFNNLKVYPESLLRNNIGPTDLIIPLIDAATFPDMGIVQIGAELIRYLSVDRINNNLVLLPFYDSMQFIDGYNQSLNVSNTSDFIFGQNDFTIELWAYNTRVLNPSSGNIPIISIGKPGGGKEIRIDQNLYGLGLGIVFPNGNNLSTLNDYYFPNPETPSNQKLGFLPVNAWTHLALVRRGTDLKIFVNGMLKKTISNIDFNLSEVDEVKIANGLYSSDGYFAGNITSVNIINGKAIYNTDFSLPVFPPKPISQSKLLLLNDPNNSLFKDYSGNNSAVIDNNGVSRSNLSPFFSSRGIMDTVPRMHTVDGFDGYYYYNPNVLFTLGKEYNIFDRIYACQSRFDLDHNAFNIIDGYKQVTKDLLTTDLSGSDAANESFPSYDYDGWHRTDPVLLLSGACVGSYLSGEQFCADGYDGVGRMLRGISLQDKILQRQEVLLSITGEPVVLIRRQRTGIVCNCYLASSEYPDDRCPKCFGTKFVMGFEQYFNARRSDGRIMVRFSPSDEDLKMQEAGLESELITECWTLTVPTIKDRDILVRFDMDGNEEYRYEVLTVNRNRTALQLEGAQKMRVQRIRKTDVAYQINAFRNTATMPAKVNTTLVNAYGIGPHKHEIVTNEKTIDNFSQLTSIVQGHNHQVQYNSLTGKLEVLETLGHTHEIII